MIDEIYSAFVSELEKIAVEAETGKDDQSADVDSEREVSPAVDKIFRMTDLTRITQSKDETGKPGASAHGSQCPSKPVKMRYQFWPKCVINFGQKGEKPLKK